MKRSSKLVELPDTRNLPCPKHSLNITAIMGSFCQRTASYFAAYGGEAILGK